jgi:hypothetical protein
MIAGFGGIFTFGLEVVQKRKDDLRCKMIERQSTELDFAVACSKRQKQFERIPVSLDTIRAHAFYVRQILLKKLMDKPREPHTTSNWDLVNAIKPARSSASLTFK